MHTFLKALLVFVALMFATETAHAGGRLPPSGGDGYNSPTLGDLTENVIDTFEHTIYVPLPGGGGQVIEYVILIPYVKTFTLGDEMFTWNDSTGEYEEINNPAEEEDDSINIDDYNGDGSVDYTYTDNSGQGANNHSDTLTPR